MNSKSVEMLYQKQLLILVCLIVHCYGIFEAPEAVLEAYEPRGFRISIPTVQGIELFAFHGNINKKINPNEPGELNQDATTSSDGVWTIFDKDLTLKPGDIVYYWTFIQHDKLGYRSENKEWKVTALSKNANVECRTSVTTVSGELKICTGRVVFEDQFNSNNIDTTNWSIDQYLPFYSPRFEFNYYDKDNQVLSIKNNNLVIKPKVDDPPRNMITFSSCTRENDDECSESKENVKTVHPVSSGRIMSTKKFRYGTVEIRAKLPGGDWMFPEIMLQQDSNSNRTVRIAYIRGNNELKISNREIGATVLYGGPTINWDDSNLKTKANNEPWSTAMHTYKITWSEDELSLFVDNNQYGTFDKNTLRNMLLSEDDNTQYRLVIGVGVGGILDFPDNSVSGNINKPWKNGEVKNMKNFYSHRNQWKSTWSGANGELQVEYVKITAL